MSNSIVGAKKKERKPRIAVDSAASVSTAKLLYGLAEGEVYGLADGARSIRLDGTPLLDDNGNGNFNGVRWTFAAGTNDQEHISGFPDVTNEIGVGVELRSDNPWIKAFNDTQLSAVRVRFKWGRLSKTNPDNGDVNGYTIKYAIDLQTDGGAYHEIINTKIQEKTSAGYERTHRIDLPKAKTGWQLRVRRLTPNSTSEYVQDTMMVDAIAEVIDVKLSYPNTALLGIEYNAEIFSSVAKVAVRVKGKIIRVPDNYDPVARTYAGIWTGNFKDAYSNNPAWVFYDLCTQWRGGLGERLDATMIDKWSLYALGQYCDQPVSDGQGGLEPRFTCNVYLQKQEEAYTVLQNIAGIFRAMSFWTGERIMLDADVPQDSIYTYSSANIVGGVAGVQYSGTRNRDRHTLAKVAWDNPNNDYQTEYEYIRDEKAMSKFGVKVLDLSAFGCTSQAQAQRAGLWALKTEQLETRQVTFSVGLDGAIPRVGNIISLSDEAFAGRANGGRVSTVNSTQRIIELDREVTASVGDVLIINGGSGKSERRNISNVVGNRITVTAGFTSAEPEHVWAIETADLKLMRFRVMSITENDDATYAITAIQHEPQKYDAIDFGTDVKPTEITIVDPDTVDAPDTVNIESRHREVQGQTVTTLVISWVQVSGAVAYDVEWRKDDGTWIKLPRTGNVSAEIEGVYSGNYTARVRAISAFDVQSQATTSILTEVKGKVGLPPAVVGLTATGILFGMELKWGFVAGSGDAAYTEIQVGSAPDVNVATLGQYSYPTNTHTINGLQGNLSQSYRARLVDKLGFKSPWSAWVTGTTDANADKVMDLIEGQIALSSLDAALRTEVAKIEGNGQAVTLANDNIATINQEIEQIVNENGVIAGEVDTLQVTVGNHTTSIQHSDSILDDLSAQSTTILDVNGYVVGTGTYNDGKTGEFAVYADSFYVAPPVGKPNDVNGTSPFMVLTTPQVIDGVTVPAGTYMRDFYAPRGSIDTLQVADAAIKSAQIDDLAVTTAKIGEAQVDTLQIAGHAVTIPRIVEMPTGTNMSYSGSGARSYEIGRVTVDDVNEGSVSISFTADNVWLRTFSGVFITLTVSLYKEGLTDPLRRKVLRASVAGGGGRILTENTLTLPPAIDDPNGYAEYYIKATVHHDSASCEASLGMSAFTVMGNKR